MTEISSIARDSGPKAPSHLSAPAREFWRWAIHEFVLEPNHLLLLAKALEAFDRAEQARNVIRRDGMFISDRYGQPRPHPAVQIERDSRDALARLLRQLDLAGEPDASRRRPSPSLGFAPKKESR